MKYSHTVVFISSIFIDRGRCRNYLGQSCAVSALMAVLRLAKAVSVSKQCHRNYEIVLLHVTTCDWISPNLGLDWNLRLREEGRGAHDLFKIPYSLMYKRQLLTQPTTIKCYSSQAERTMADLHGEP